MQALDDTEAYPNLQAVLQNTIAGPTTDWPLVAAELRRLLGELAEARAKQPINTHVRLFDLVRHQRAELHTAELITDEEYHWLCYGSGMATSPKGGSPSPRRLEDYDALRARLTAAEADGKRLDWLARNPRSFMGSRPIGCPDKIAGCLVGHYAKPTLDEIRAAIDAAMNRPAT